MQLLLKFDTVLGLKIEQVDEKEQEAIPEEVQELLKQRQQARNEKNWAESDRLRDEIQSKGYILKDSKEGTTIEKK